MKRVRKAGQIYFYADSEISVDMTMERLGINKSKINTLLKNEVGMTFAA